MSGLDQVGLGPPFFPSSFRFSFSFGKLFFSLDCFLVHFTLPSYHSIAAWMQVGLHVAQVHNKLNSTRVVYLSSIFELEREWRIRILRIPTDNVLFDLRFNLKIASDASASSFQFRVRFTWIFEPKILSWKNSSKWSVFTFFWRQNRKYIWLRKFVKIQHCLTFIQPCFDKKLRHFKPYLGHVNEV